MGSEVSGGGVIENPFGSNREASSGDDYPLNFPSNQKLSLFLCVFFLRVLVLAQRG